MVTIEASSVPKCSTSDCADSFGTQYTSVGGSGSFCCKRGSLSEEEVREASTPNYVSRDTAGSLGSALEKLNGRSGTGEDPVAEMFDWLKLHEGSFSGKHAMSPKPHAHSSKSYAQSSKLLAPRKRTKDIADLVADETVRGLDGVPETAEYDVHIQRSNSGEKLGIIITRCESMGVQVLSLTEGLVNDWNSKNPDATVRPGDFLLAVNGDQEVWTDLARPLLFGRASGNDVHLRFRRRLMTRARSNLVEW